MSAVPAPAWLPPMHAMSPWSEAVMEGLYAIFRNDFVVAAASYLGARVWFFPDQDRGKELIFWHLVEREDPPGSGNRLPDFRRSERLPWARPMLDQCTDPAIKAWDFEEGAGNVRTYVWLENHDYVIVMKRYPSGERRLITAYYVDYDSKRRTLNTKYKNRLP